jgi:hypothetical protein
MFSYLAFNLTPLNGIIDFDAPFGTHLAEALHNLASNPKITNNLVFFLFVLCFEDEAKRQRKTIKIKYSHFTRIPKCFSYTLTEKHTII